MNITTDLIEAFLKCPTKCYLRAHEQVETGNAYADWLRTRSEIFRREGIKRLVAGFTPDKCAEGGVPMMVTGKSAQWKLATDFVGQAENLQCSCHAMERRQPAGRKILRRMWHRDWRIRATCHVERPAKTPSIK